MDTMANHHPVDAAAAMAAVPSVTIGGLPIAVISRDETADLMLALARHRPRGQRPLYFTSANGEVIARVSASRALAALFDSADQIVADGQPMVLASRFLCTQPLSERVATTDLFHDVARRAEASGQSFYLLGARPPEIARAVQVIRATYPLLNIVGYSHGYHRDAALAEKVAEIDALAPDILWVGMGVPHEQTFVRDHADRLRHVGIIKTSGGLFNFLSGSNRRAPAWMQRMGLEWAYRLYLEPRRLGWRYLSTNPKAMLLMLTRSR